MIFLICWLMSGAFAHEEDGGGASVGKGKGVESYDPNKGFTLSKEAFQRLEIQSVTYSGGAHCDLKNVQVISALGKSELFYIRDEKIKSAPLNCVDLKNGDRLVTKGAGFLRVIEMDLAGGEDHDE